MSDFLLKTAFAGFAIASVLAFISQQVPLGLVALGLAMLALGAVFKD